MSTSNSGETARPRSDRRAASRTERAPCWSWDEFGKELAFEEVRRRHDLAVADADDRRPVLAIGLEHGAVFVRRHERLIGEGEHGGIARRQVLDCRAERAPHPGRELQVYGMPDGQAIKRGQRGLVLAAHDDQNLVEACRADLPDGAPDERLVAEREEQLLLPPIRVDAPAASTTALTMKKQCSDNALTVRNNLDSRCRIAIFSAHHLSDARVARHARHCRGRRLAT